MGRETTQPLANITERGNVRQKQENVNNDHYPMAVRELQ
jgi:hypothetical protein